MNEEDKKILELYLKDSRKKKIFLIAVIIVFISIFIFYGYYARLEQSSDQVENNSINEETQTNIINNSTNEETSSNTENSTKEEKAETQIETNEANKTSSETANKENIQEASKKESNEKEKTKTTTASNENKEKNTKEKPANKDFLFTDGYTMDNVTQAAQDYLKAYDFGGECVPIKDNEGVYLGMRVIFY